MDAPLVPAYVQRFAEELSDHLTDLKEESMEGDLAARVGAPEQVADTAAVAYRRRSFLGRHPLAAFLVFGLSPLVSLVVLWGAAFLAIGTAQKFASFPCLFNEEHYGPVALAAWAYGFTVAMSVVPSVLACLFCCRLADRLRFDRRWTLVSCAIVAIVAAMYCFRVAPYQSNTGQHLGVSDGLGLYSPTQLLQFVIPIALGWWLICRRQEQRELGLAS